MFIQDLNQIIECVKAICIKFIKDKDKGWLLVTQLYLNVVSDNISPTCAKGLELVVTDQEV